MASTAAVGSLSTYLPANSAAMSALPPPPTTIPLFSRVPIVCRSSANPLSSSEGNVNLEHWTGIDRRQVVMSSIGFLAAAVCQLQRIEDAAFASEYADMPALWGKDYGKTKMRYPDYTETNSGLQYKDLRLGSGPSPKSGEIVVVLTSNPHSVYHRKCVRPDYYGRIFEARNKTKGGSFVGDDKDFYKFILRTREVIPAFEEAVSSMALGGIRRIIVPPELGYTDNDFNKQGPRPTTFSGQRALDFVLRNQGLIDKTLLFDIELLKIVSN